MQIFLGRRGGGINARPFANHPHKSHRYRYDRADRAFGDSAGEARRCQESHTYMAYVQSYLIGLWIGGRVLAPTRRTLSRSSGYEVAGRAAGFGATKLLRGRDAGCQFGGRTQRMRERERERENLRDNFKLEAFCGADMPPRSPLTCSIRPSLQKLPKAS